ncbi:MAG: hypothetical protein UZ02_AOB001000139, partial [Nitrosomonas europaea]
LCNADKTFYRTQNKRQESGWTSQPAASLQQQKRRLCERQRREAIQQRWVTTAVIHHPVRLRRPPLRRRGIGWPRPAGPRHDGVEASDSVRASRILLHYYLIEEFM